LSNLVDFEKEPSILHSKCVSVSLSTLAKLVAKLAMLAVSSIVWNMESSLMVKCHQTR